MSAETELETHFGSLILKRPETSPKLPLRAWTSADVVALEHLEPMRLGNVLLVNDTFGALAVALRQQIEATDQDGESKIVTWSDSARSRRSVQQNLELNGYATDSVEVLSGDVCPDDAFDTIVINLPKSVELLDYQLAQLQQCAMPAATIFGSALSRHVRRSMLAIFRKQLGVVMPSRAVKKARLIHVTLPAPGVVVPTADGWAGQIIDHRWYPNEIPDYITDDGIKIFEGPGTFSQGRLDNATRLLLETLTDLTSRAENTHFDVLRQLNENHTVLDLGCGTGVIAATLAAQNPQPHFILADSSDIAIRCAEQVWNQNGYNPGGATFIAADGLAGVESDSVDLVVTNPPFHEGHTVDKALTTYLLRESARVLKPGATIFTVAPRQVEIHKMLRNGFDNVRAVTKHPEFVVVAATSRNR